MWDDLPLLTSRDGPLEALAGSNLSGRIAGNSKVPDGVYKFVVDKNGKVWLQGVADDLPHSALVPKGEQVRGAGYIAIKKGRANISGRSGHYMKDSGLIEGGEAWARYDTAIRRTFGDWLEIIKHEMGGATAIRPPGS